MRARVSHWFIQASFLKSGRSAAVFAVVLGCSIGGRSLPAQTNADKPAGGPAITAKEAEEFSQALAAATAGGDFARTNELVDWEEIADRGTQTPNLPELKPAREAFKSGILQSTRKSGHLFAALNQIVKSGGSYDFLRAELKGKEPFVQFRLRVPNNGGLNYHRLYLVRRPDGRIVAADIFILLSGERMSETLAHAWLPLATKTLRENQKTKTASAALDEELAISQKLVDLKTREKYQELLEAYKKAPESSRRNKINLILGLTAAEKVSTDEYGAMIEAYRKFYPDHPSLDFILIDGYILQQKYDEALACVDRTIEQLGADAALYALRANVLVLQKKLPPALAEIRKAIAAEPDSADYYSTGADIAVAARDHAATLEFLTALEQKFGVEFRDLTESPDFAEFVKSPQFKTWQAAHPKK